MSYIILLFLIWNCSATTGFYIKSHFPVSNSSYFPRLRMIGSLPSLQQFTICSWLKCYFNDNQLLTFLSYATSTSLNEIMISLAKSDPERLVRLYIGEPYTDFSCSTKWISGEWYHLSVTWYSPTGTAKVYQNGNICMHSYSNNPYKKTAVLSGGILIIGQEQDGLDSRYDTNQSWNGDIADVQIWNEALNVDQIREAGKCNGERKDGNVFSWMRTEMIAIGNVVFSETQLCYP